MKAKIAATLAILGSLALVACSPRSLESAIEDECHGPWGKSAEALSARTLGNGEGEQGESGVEVKITCQNGRSHIVNVK